MYGIQTDVYNSQKVLPFENDVKMYGIQTQATADADSISLRMM